MYPHQMEIGHKLRELREAKHLSQADIHQKTGLLRNYTSRVENGFTVPSVETLEKYAYALGIPLYRFFTEGEAVRVPKLPVSRQSAWQVGGKHREELRLFAKAFNHMDARSRRVLLSLAQEMARRHDPPRRIKSKDRKRNPQAGVRPRVRL
jgi:transcriptional regulator with XRE-family HTH domain